MRKSRAVDFAMMLDSFIPELVRAARNQESRRLSRYALTLPQFFALSCLEEGPRMMKELGEDLGLTLGTVTGIVDRLARAGLAERFSDEKDRRIVRARLTPRGEELMGQIHRERVEWLSRQLQEMEEDDIARFAELLSKYGMRLASGNEQDDREGQEGTDVP
jgi:DNA-binding MarR family transcriptional regulator